MYRVLAFIQVDVTVTHIGGLTNLHLKRGVRYFCRNFFLVVKQAEGNFQRVWVRLLASAENVGCEICLPRKENRGNLMSALPSNGQYSRVP